MLVADMMQPGGKVFLKSEFGPIGDNWPCFSYGRPALGRRLQAEFQPGRDIIVYVGTTDPSRTEDPDHRSRLISAVSVQPGQVLETRRIVPEEHWRQAVARFGEDSWCHAMPVLDAALMEGPPFPHAREVVPRAYASFAAIENRGGVVEATGAERDAVMALPVARIELRFTESVRRYMDLMASIRAPSEKSIQQEAFRMATLIEQRVRSGGEPSSRMRPVRSAPNLSDLIALITRKWGGQKGRCALCGGPLAAAANGMLQASTDRIDSTNPAYDDANAQITHLACNLAKNKYGAQDFGNWLAVVREPKGDLGIDVAAEVPDGTGAAA